MASRMSSSRAALDRLRRHLDQIDRDVARVVDRYRDHVKCHRGCSDCCHQTFEITDIEAEYLRLGLAETDAQTRADIEARAAAYQPNERAPCPVLGPDGGCRLYAYRPRICRKYGIPLWHPDRPHEVRTCELNFRGMADIDAELILAPQAAWAEDWIVLRDDLKLGAPRKQSIAAAMLAV